MPKRIYLLDYNDAMVTPLEGDTIYVRADVFIEKAAEWLKENADMYEAFEPESKSYYMDKDKLVEDFKNYMKGE